MVKTIESMPTDKWDSLRPELVSINKSASSKDCMKVLTSEYHKIMDHPLEKITLGMDENNFQIWYYLIHGSKGTPYEDGLYLGAIIFPTEYPNKAPEFQMISPSGRFSRRKAICMTMSAYHAESWNPTWSMEKILYGFVSFMNSNEHGAGAIAESDSERREYAHISKQWLYVKCTLFKIIFPDEYEILNHTFNNASLTQMKDYILNDPIQNALSHALMKDRIETYKLYEQEITSKVATLPTEKERVEFYHKFFSALTPKDAASALVGFNFEVSGTHDLLNQHNNGHYDEDVFAEDDEDEDLPEIYDSEDDDVGQEEDEEQEEEDEEATEDEYNKSTKGGGQCVVEQQISSEFNNLSTIVNAPTRE